jgi:hypothetical protein
VKALSERARTASPEVIDLLSRRDPDLCEYIERKEADRKPDTKLISPFVDGVTYSKEYAEEFKERPKYKPPKDWSDFKGDYWEKYDYIMAQDPEALTAEELEFIEWYRGTPEYRAVYEAKPGPTPSNLSGG